MRDAVRSPCRDSEAITDKIECDACMLRAARINGVHFLTRNTQARHENISRMQHKRNLKRFCVCCTGRMQHTNSINAIVCCNGFLCLNDDMSWFIAECVAVPRELPIIRIILFSSFNIRSTHPVDSVKLIFCNITSTFGRW